MHERTLDGVRSRGGVRQDYPAGSRKLVKGPGLLLVTDDLWEICRVSGLPKLEVCSVCATHQLSRLRTVAITAGRSTPAARFRVGQLTRDLSQLGVDLIWRPAIVPKHPPAQKWLRPLWLPAAVTSRIPDALLSWQGDVTLLLREMVSTLVSLEPVTKRPRVFDVDDAIWLHRGGGFAKYLARHVDMVIAGNSFLANWFCDLNPHTVVLPTAVDTDRYKPAQCENDESKGLVIGWSGTSGNLRYLSLVETALAKVLKSHPNARVRVVADRRPRFSEIPAERVEFVRWTPANEVSSIQSMDIGIMPLEDSDWARGKCSYKMLLYMACGLPVVVSPVGMNAEVLNQAPVGMGAQAESDWVEALRYLAESPGERARLGTSGRKLVCERYSVEVVAPQLASHLRSVAE